MAASCAVRSLACPEPELVEGRIEGRRTGILLHRSVAHPEERCTAQFFGSGPSSFDRLRTAQDAGMTNTSNSERDMRDDALPCRCGRTYDIFAA
jgi:hypothetical protein